MRWASRDQWHVTLRFLGEVEDPSLVDEALRQTELAAGEATLGPKVERLGRQVLCIPVEGLDALAAAVVGATATLGQPPEDRPFRGHLTLARVVGAGRRGGRKARGQRTIRDHRLVGAPFDARWSVDEVVVVRSHLGSSGARYEDLQIHTLTRN